MLDNVLAGVYQKIILKIGQPHLIDVKTTKTKYIFFVGKAVELDGFESSYAKAGKICAIIGIVIGVIYLILTILAVVFSMSVGGLSTILRA